MTYGGRSEIIVAREPINIHSALRLSLLRELLGNSGVVQITIFSPVKQ